MSFGVKVIVAAAAAMLAFAGPSAAGAVQPNIVLIVTDDQRWDTLQYMPTVQNELAAHGVTFTNAFATNPLCCPSRASILTGAYSHTTGMYDNADGAHFRDQSTLATWLDAAGYETGFFGKYMNRYRAPYIPPGWDRWTAFDPNGFYNYGFTRDGVVFPRADQPTYSTDLFAQEALQFLDSSPRPFFLYYAPYAPHKPATPAERHAGAFAGLPDWRPPSYNERDVSDKPPWIRHRNRLGADGRAQLDEFRRLQAESLLAVDEAVAALVQSLSDSGDLANTIVVFMSDHGYLWGEHRLRGKWLPYEESIRMPFVVRYDALVEAPRTETRPVLNIDVAPTLTELAGVSAPGSEGESFLPLLAGGDQVAWRTRFLVEGKRPYCAIRTLQRLFVVYGSGDRELYDLAADPFQLENLVQRPGSAPRIAQLRAELARLCNPPPPGLSRRLLCTHAGTGGRDVLIGSPRYDIVCAGRGNDVIDPGEARDYVFAGRGADVIRARDGAVDVISCGPGRDVALVDARDRRNAGCEDVRSR